MKTVVLLSAGMDSVTPFYEVAREHAQSFLRESHRQKIVNPYRRFEDREQFAAVAALDF